MPTTFPMHHFDKYNFVKSFVAIAKTEAQKEEKEKEALVIAEAIEQHQEILSQNLSTKVDIELVRKDIELLRTETKKDIISVHKDIELLRAETKKDITSVHKDIELLRTETKKEIESIKKDLILLENKLTIKLTAIMAALMTFLPLAIEFLKRSF